MAAQQVEINKNNALAQEEIAKQQEAEGKRLVAEALDGGSNVVALKFAEMIPSHLQVWGISKGRNNTSLMDISGVFGKMFEKKRLNLWNKSRTAATDALSEI